MNDTEPLIAPGSLVSALHGSSAVCECVRMGEWNCEACWALMNVEQSHDRSAHLFTLLTEAGTVKWG